MADALNATPATPKRDSRKRSSTKLSLRQAFDMQQVLHQMVVSGAGRPLELASCARAWSDLEDRKRVIKGKPLPGALKPVAEPKRKKSTVEVSE